MLRVVLKTAHSLTRAAAASCAVLALACAVAAAADPVHITIGYYESSGGLGQTGRTMEALIAEFVAANPHITVSTTVAPYRAFFDRLAVELAAGTGPDVWLSDGVLIEQFAAQGFALELTDRIAADLDPGQYFGIEDNRDPQGRVFAFPQGLQSSALFYNKDLFDMAGVAHPSADWTLDDVRSTARLLTVDRNGDNVPDQYGFRSFNHITEGWYPIIRAFGGGALDASRRNSLFADPRTIQGLTWMVDLIHADHTSPPASVGIGPFDWFPRQLVAMQIGLYVRTYAATQAGLNYDVTLVPAGPAGRYHPVIVNSWIINAHAAPEKHDAAWEWIKFFAGERAQTVWAELGEAVPINREVAISVFLAGGGWPANRIAFVEGMAYSTPLDPNPVWNNWQSAATTALAPAFNGQMSVAEAALNAHRQVQAILDDFYGD